jgi:hypothetical protein
MHRSRKPVAFALVVVALVCLGAAGTSRFRAVAQDATPPAHGAVGVAGKVFGGVEPIVAPGHRLEIYYMEWAPGALVTPHYHPMSYITCVESGALGFTMLTGAVTLTRAGTGEMPESTEQVQPDVEVILEPGDCISVDNEANNTIHSARNAGDGVTVAWEADFYPIGQPATVFVDEHGMPIEE